jgi:23S rRNA (adenine2030-N6)-methyltransferase
MAQSAELFIMGRAMNYRHAYHAGNFADVAKHLALVSILTHLRKKPQPFAVIDTHAGRGLYDLEGDEAKRSGEAASGIARLADLQDGPGTLMRYLEIARSFGASRYPGSPSIAAAMLRAQDRLVAIEKHPDDAMALQAALKTVDRARAVQADGYARLPALLPPPERRGLVLIDPPFEAPDEFTAAARAANDGLRRFATGIFAVWFPIKSPAAADAFCGEVQATKMLRVDMDVGGDRERLSAAGLLVVNPPYGFAADMEAALGRVALHLGRSGAARVRVAWLAGSE